MITLGSKEELGEEKWEVKAKYVCEIEGEIGKILETYNLRKKGKENILAYLALYETFINALDCISIAPPDVSMLPEIKRIYEQASQMILDTITENIKRTSH